MMKKWSIYYIILLQNCSFIHMYIHVRRLYILNNHDSVMRCALLVWKRNYNALVVFRIISLLLLPCFSLEYPHEVMLQAQHV